MNSVKIHAGDVTIEINGPSPRVNGYKVPAHFLDTSGDAEAVGDDARHQAVELPEGIVLDEARGLMWSRDDVVPKACKHAAAEKACRELRLGGFDDWRLPTIAELLTLVDYARHEPAIDVEKFPACKSAWYWTSTPAAWSSDFAWVVAFGFGLADGARRGASLALARAVRSVPAGQ
jgi:hypothetical protein